MPILWRRSGQKKLHAPLAVLRRRAATGLGAVLLALAAMAFAAAGDVAQRMFLRAVAAWPYLPLVLTPLVFAAVAFATRRWMGAAAGSGIPQVIAASRMPASAR